MSLHSRFTSGRFGPLARLAFCLLAIAPLVSLAEPRVPPRSSSNGVGNGGGDEVFGFSEPVQTIELAASETGILKTLNVEPGEAVRKGQQLGHLDSDVLLANSEIVAARVAATAKLRAAEIRVNRATRTYEKLQSLYEEGHGGSRELEIAASDLELARTDLTAVEEETTINRLDLSRIQAELRRRQIVSPIDGVVSEIHRDPGEFVAATTPDVMTIVDLSQLRIRFYPAADAATRFRKGRYVQVRFAHSGQVASARVDFVSPVIDADSNTVRIEVLIDNAQRNYHSGRRCVLLPDTVRDQPHPESPRRSQRAALGAIRRPFVEGRL